MSPHKCYGCRRAFARTSSLTAHYKKCSDVLTIRRRSMAKWNSASLKEREICGSDGLREQDSEWTNEPTKSHDHTGNSQMGQSSQCSNYDTIEPDMDLTPVVISAPSDTNLLENTEPFVSVPSSPSLIPSPPQLGRGHRIKKPKKRDDWLPEGPPPMPHPLNEMESTNDPESEALTSSTVAPRQFLQITPNVRLIFVRKFWTSTNSFGISRLYYGEPSCIPEHRNTIADMSSGTLQPRHSQLSNREIQEIIWPYPNISCWRLGMWLWKSGDTKSLAGFKDLVNNVLLADDFTPADLRGVAWDKIHLLLGEILPMVPQGEGWRKAHVEIQVPTGVKRKANDKTKDSMRASKTFTVPGLYYRPICTIIRSVFSDDEAATTFHFNPFKQFWKTSEGRTERVRDELFNSDVWLQAQEEIEALPREPNDTLPRCVAALMFSSDATHLAQFGQAKLWPVYLAFGNQSKWMRCRPSAHASHHVVYLPSLPDSVIEFIRGHVSSGAADALKTHCRRELFHAALNFLFDEEFLEAWKKGIAIDCIDGVKRQVFPRIFTWSADYPEKRVSNRCRVLLASIRDLGTYPCPRCLVKKDDIPRIGMKSDRNTRVTKARVDSTQRRDKVERARNSIYRDGFVVNSDTVNQSLKDESLTPTENVFSRNLHNKGFNFFSMLVVDLMHEIELGVWKALFTHLVRMLYSIGEAYVDTLNTRFRLIPTFGASTIRPFSADVSQMKKLAAHNFEDMLQCCMPAFQGLFGDEWDNKIQDLLFTLCYWHGIAKLRMHTDTTVELLDSLTTELGKLLRFFENVVCRHFDTFETPAEKAAQVRARMRTAQKAGVDTTIGGPAPPFKETGGPRRRVFNMKTFKIHEIGHYVSDIRTFGSTDSYSTQTGELEHRVAKSRYRHRTNKNQFTSQLTKLSQRVENMNRSTQKLRSYNIKIPEHQVGRGGTSSEMREPISPEDMYHIARDRRHPLYFREWLQRYPDDPAFRDFLPKLQNHLLSRIHGIGGIGDERSSDGNDNSTIYFQHERIYSHAILRINFTTYNLRRDQDFINPRTSKCFVMVPSNDDSEVERRKYPFWYAQVLGVFHADTFLSVNSQSLKPTRMDFLWVRWLGQDPTWNSGFKFRKLDRIGFVPYQDEDAFGFLDPMAVIRAAHLIPAFTYGRTIDLCPPSVARDDEGDWQYFYVNRFVDRDMLMRYLGVGIGHKSSIEKSCEDPGLHTEGLMSVDMQSEQQGEGDLDSENEGMSTEGEIDWDEVDFDSENDGDEAEEVDSAEDFDIGDY